MTTESMPAFIEEANELYKTDPAGAVALLYEGTRELKGKRHRNVAAGPPTDKDRDKLILDAGFRLMEWMKEDAQEGILPIPLHWELKVGVARDIVRITTKNENRI